MGNEANHTIKSNFESGYADINGLKMYYEIHGSGFPLVLIHGGGSTIESTFGNVINQFAKTHKVIAVELQAHGRTADIDRPLSFTQDAYDVAGLLKQLNIEKADIFGFSNGASTTLQFALHHPEVVNKIIIASTFFNKNGYQKAKHLLSQNQYNQRRWPTGRQIKKIRLIRPIQDTSYREAKPNGLSHGLSLTQSPSSSAPPPPSLPPETPIPGLSYSNLKMQGHTPRQNPLRHARPESGTLPSAGVPPDTQWFGWRYAGHNPSNVR